MVIGPSHSLGEVFVSLRLDMLISCRGEHQACLQALPPATSESSRLEPPCLSVGWSPLVKAVLMLGLLSYSWGHPIEWPTMERNVCLRPLPENF
jgi:hypothetical protein